MTASHSPRGVPGFAPPRLPDGRPGALPRFVPTTTPAAPRAPRSTPRPAPLRVAPARTPSAQPELAVTGRRRLPRFLLAALALVAVVTVGGAQVLQTSQTATVGYQLAALEQERQLLSAEIRLAEADVARLSRREEVRRIAEEELGMVPATDAITIAVSAPVPRTIPLPERYVAPVEPFAPRSVSWWEHLAGLLPGAH